MKCYWPSSFWEDVRIREENMITLHNILYLARFGINLQILGLQKCLLPTNRKRLKIHWTLNDHNFLHCILYCRFINECKTHYVILNDWDERKIDLINKNCPSGHNTTDHSSFIHVNFDITTTLMTTINIMITKCTACYTSTLKSFLKWSTSKGQTKYNASGYGSF